MQTRDFTYVTDAVQALVRAADTAGVSGQVYNIGTGRGVNLLELVAQLNHLLGKKLVPTHAAPRSGDVRHSRADISKARQELSYEPEVSFEEGLAQTLRWHRTQ